MLSVVASVVLASQFAAVSVPPKPTVYLFTWYRGELARDLILHYPQFRRSVDLRVVEFTDFIDTKQYDVWHAGQRKYWIATNKRVRTFPMFWVAGTKRWVLAKDFVGTDNRIDSDGVVRWVFDVSVRLRPVRRHRLRHRDKRRFPRRRRVSK